MLSCHSRSRSCQPTCAHRSPFWPSQSRWWHLTSGKRPPSDTTLHADTTSGGIVLMVLDLKVGGEGFFLKSRQQHTHRLYHWMRTFFFKVSEIMNTDVEVERHRHEHEHVLKHVSNHWDFEILLFSKNIFQRHSLCTTAPGRLKWCVFLRNFSSFFL